VRVLDEGMVEGPELRNGNFKVVDHWNHLQALFGT